ncbi:unnamed protein product [Effrenium voratum]|uniref:Uncharacterized protein n=2 Tax=Effrenium voratum TaxID=2562239 RepID=A0AA36NKY3_9DINO|nr:unnamed protein product [Effrenium voratum]
MAPDVHYFLQQAHCPQGEPGSCLAGRVGRGCGSCEFGTYVLADGSCAPCTVLLFDIVWANMGYVLALEYGTNNLLALKEGNFEPCLHSLILWGLARLFELSILHRAAEPLWKLMEGLQPETVST